ncbi:MAG: 16S rRNA (guanine(966)-N(2))-methyltransferase RsmD [Candidatus Eremiobacteraeota bacterium]|nr:16S rRNA (guanine(966)-N(2))-methyltransferase RsmD [Candidatus Eremiobacteraeota bacterium]
MRLAGGENSGRAVAAPKGRRTRPTGAKVREALFAVLGDRIQGARVLDLFAGSGALGFEAISRGAASVIFVDNDAAAAMAIRRNAVDLIEDAERWRIMPMHAARALRRLRGKFDVVLVDPPYDRGAEGELALLAQRGLLASDGVLVVEHRSTAPLTLPSSMQVIKRSKYGDTAVTYAKARGRSAASLRRTPPPR